MTDRRVTGLVICLLFTFYVLLSSLRIDSGDGEVMYQVTRSVLEGRGFAISPPLVEQEAVDSQSEPLSPDQVRRSGPYGSWGIDGQYYAQYGVGQSLLAVPFYLLGRWSYRWMGLL